ncbi:type II secretion system F family protein [Chitinibacter sp. S2-10]|uniref:type II secretion system F family protein n=1 Tax=Chitinibacter sp. S2-10 TaxID=3373597 RepID=UPI00397725B8
MAWRYRALDRNGNEMTDVIDVASETAAQQFLRQSGLHILELREIQPELDNEGNLSTMLHPAAWLGINQNDLILLFRQLSLLLRSGNTLINAINTSIQISGKYRMKRVLEIISLKLQQGQSFSSALADIGKPFTPMMAELISSGEQIGELSTVLERLALDLERSKELRQQLITSSIYPVMVFLLSVGVVLYLVLTVVPKFQSFLEARGKAIPWAAQTLLDTVHWLLENGLFAFTTIALLAAAILLSYRINVTRYWIDQILLKIPIVGSCIISANMAKTCWTLAILLQSGLSLLSSLRITAYTIDNHVHRQALLEAGEKILQGQSLAQSLKIDIFPKLFAQMALLGEKTGEIAKIMTELGLFFRKELDQRVKLLSLLVEPMMILLVGGIVGFVYFAFFQAVFTLSTR